MGDGAGAVVPAIADREGNPIPFTLEPAVPTDEDKRLLKQSEDRRQLVQINFTFDGVQPVEIIDSRDGSKLAILSPRIAYPEWLFELLEETRDIGFAPVGFTNFVETGTLFGHTLLHASYWFEKAYSIELSKDLHAQAVKHMAHRKNVTCVQGNSGERLPDVIAELSGPSVFFLDAHWRGDSTVDWENSKFGGYPVETARIDDPNLSEGERQVPLLSELRHVVEGHKDAAMVIIDDWQAPYLDGGNFVGEDWSHIDPDKLISWIDEHPRTQRRFLPTYNRLVWLINAE